MSDTSKAQAESTQPTQQKKTPQVLEEDDEFEDFPVEGELATARCRCGISC
jgi:26 proteasome complex subunit DSS1